MKPATELPWILSDEPEHSCCYDASIREAHPLILEDGRQMTWHKRIAEARKDDAAYIVHACNNLPRGMGALRKTIAAFAEMKPSNEKYSDVSDAANLLKELDKVAE